VFGLDFDLRVKALAPRVKSKTSSYTSRQPRKQKSCM
jgi:hypothetical protein